MSEEHTRSKRIQPLKTQRMEHSTILMENSWCRPLLQVQNLLKTEKKRTKGCKKPGCLGSLGHSPEYWKLGAVTDPTNEEMPIANV